MAETNPHPYDLDVIDPIVVEEYRSPLQWIIPVVLMVFVLVMTWRIRGDIYPYATNSWTDLTEPFRGANSVAFLCSCVGALIALAWCLWFQRWILALGALLVIGYVVLALFLMIIKTSDLSARDRIKAELPIYKDALLTKTKYGVQASQKVNGRTLTYWRWIQWSRGHASGVIYDPAKKLDIEKDSSAFNDLTKGQIYQIEKIEPSWYLVRHW